MGGYYIVGRRIIYSYQKRKRGGGAVSSPGELHTVKFQNGEEEMERETRKRIHPRGEQEGIGERKKGVQKKGGEEGA